MDIKRLMDDKNSDVLFLLVHDFLPTTVKPYSRWVLYKILEAYQNREDMEKFAHLASFDEIIENDYNLNIPRYVDTFEEETPIDLVALSKEITDLNAEIAKTEQEFLSLLGELAETDETKEMIEATKAIFR